MANIHKLAVVSEKAKLADDVQVGPFCVIGDNVEIGSGTILKSHIVIEGITKIGKNNKIFPFATIGVSPQDLKYTNEPSEVIIGDNNTIREHVTIHLGTKDGAMKTTIGSNCLLMVGVHVAHDCVVGNRVILANNATLAGHVEVGDDVVIGGLSAIHQFVRIGKGAMIGGMSGVEGDIIPNGLVMGERAKLAGLNLVGMKRRGLSREEISSVRAFFKALQQDDEKTFVKKVEDLSEEFKGQEVSSVIDFVQKESSRSFCPIKKK